MEYAQTTRKTRQNTIKVFMKHQFFSLLKLIFLHLSLIFQLRVLSSEIEPAMRFLQTLPTGCLQQDVVNKIQILNKIWGSPY